MKCFYLGIVPGQDSPCILCSRPQYSSAFGTIQTLLQNSLPSPNRALYSNFCFSVFDKKDTGGLASQAGTQGYVQTFVFPAPVDFLPFVQGGRFVGIMQFAPYFIFRFAHFAKVYVVSI